MKESGLAGSVVNIASILAKTGFPGNSNYTASKAGVVGFTKTAAKELGKFGIRVNAILPGFVRTPMTDLIPEKEILSSLALILTALFRSRRACSLKYRLEILVTPWMWLRSLPSSLLLGQNTLQGLLLMSMVVSRFNIL